MAQQSIDAGSSQATTQSASPGRLRPVWVFAVLVALLLVAVLVSVAVGPVSVPLDQTLTILLKPLVPADDAIRASYETIVRNIRLPRVLTAIVVGWMLAMCGTVMQGVFQNPLASPYLLGIASGASAGAALVMVLGWRHTLGEFALPLGAFLGGVFVVSAVYGLARARSTGHSAAQHQHAGYSLILAGVALGALFSAVTTFLIFLSGEQMREIIFWIMGNLGRSSWDYMPWLVPLALCGTLMLGLYMREVNALSLGSGAKHLGLNPQRLHRILLFWVTTLTAAAVSVAGTIGFVGLITPHAMRLLLGPDHRLLLPASALLGAVFLLVSDTVARTALSPVELPVGVLTAFTGAPFFLFLLFVRREKAMQW